MLRQLVTLMSIILCCGKVTAAPLEVGVKVPAVQATNQDGKRIDLSAELAEGITLVYFYPKASTGG